jgi:hypothetical protein
MHLIEQLDMPRMVDRRIFEDLPQAISDFLADRAAMNAVDLHVGVVGQSRHEAPNPLVLKPQVQTNAAAANRFRPVAADLARHAINLVQMERNLSAA